MLTSESSSLTLRTASSTRPDSMASRINMRSCSSREKMNYFQFQKVP
jgi:hypothetical protein